MKLKYFFFVLFFSAEVLLLPKNSKAQLPVDENGWTVFTPSPDTRIYYVDDVNGNDATAQYVEASSVADPKNPGAVNAYKTFVAAAMAARDGYPDWVLLKRGGEWKDETWPTINAARFKSGRSATEPIMIGYYGASGDRPVIKLGTRFIDHNGQVRSHVVLNGLFLYNYKQDPNNPDYVAGSLNLPLRLIGGGENILIEDCMFRFIEIAVQNYAGAYKNIKFRRNIVLDAYHPQSGLSSSNRSSGIFASDVDGLLIEECTFDHNGWNEQVANADATQYSHNIYIQYTASGVVVRNNIITRGSAHGVQLRSCGIAEENLFVQNAVSLNMGYHAHESDRDTVAVAKNNVILEGRKMDPDGSTGNLSTTAVWGIWTSRERFLVENNIVANRISPTSNTAFPNDWGAITDYVNNTIYQWEAAKDMSNPSWIDPERSIATYNGSLGKAATHEAFLAEVRERPLGTWYPEYEAKAVNDYIREGFSVAGNQAPNVSFVNGGVSGEVPVTVNFTPTVNDPDGDALSYIWKFEDTFFYPDGSNRELDKAFSTDPTGKYTYTYPGTYKVTLTVYDGNGGSATYVDNVTVTGNYPPQASLTSDVKTGEAPLTVNFDASGSQDANEDELTYIFEFGDGSLITTKDPTVSHVYPPGNYTAKVTVDDGNGSLDSKTVSGISVSDPTTEFTNYPVEADAYLYSGNPDANYGTVPYSNIDQNTKHGIFRVDYSANTNEIISAEFNIPIKFGSNECAVKYVEDDSWGELSVTWNNQPIASEELASSTNGKFDITDKVKNEADKVMSLLLYEHGNSWQEFRYREAGFAFALLRMQTRFPTSNHTPVALAAADETYGDAPFTVNFDASGSTDADGHILSYTWNFGDGSPNVNGAAAQHTYYTEGSYIVTVIADDGQGVQNGSRDIDTLYITVPTYVTGVTVIPEATEVSVGYTTQLEYVVSPGGATDKSVTWSSGDETIATVDANGLVSGLQFGTTTITATTNDGGFTAVCTVTVTPVAVSGASLDKTTLTLAKWESEQLTATITPEDAEDKTVTWSSNNESVAVVDASGYVTATGPGVAVITVTTVDGGHTATCEITVTGGNGVTHETFTDLTASTSSYNAGTYVGDNQQDWKYNSVLKRTDGINGVTADIRRYNGYVETVLPDGLNDLTFTIRTHPTAAVTALSRLSVFVDGVSYGIFQPNTVGVPRTITISGINKTGNVTLRFKGEGYEETWLDDINWTDNYTSNPPSLSFTEPLDMNMQACDFADQAALDLAFNNWLDEVVSEANIGGGCGNPQISNDVSGTPELCAGGITTVTWTVSSPCDTITFDASFTVNPDSAVVIDCPADVTLSKCASVEEIEEAYISWVAGFVFSGGCSNAADNLAELPALDIDPVTGGSISFTYEVWDNCNQVSCTSVFTVVPCPIDELCTYGQGFYARQNGQACNLETTQDGNALIESLLASGPLKIGAGDNLVIFDEGDASLIGNILPGSNKEEIVLNGVCIPSDDASCLSAYLNHRGRISNQLFAQTLVLGLNLRVYGGLQFLPLEAGKYLTTQQKVSCQYGSGLVPISCEPEYDPYQYYELAEDVLCYMAENSYELTVKGLYKLASEVLGGVVDPATASACTVDREKIAQTIETINGAFEGCRAFVGYLDGEIGCGEMARVKSASITDSDQPGDLELKTYPNPFVEQIRFEFSSNQGGHATITLLNMQGNKVAGIVKEKLVKGKRYAVVFNAELLVPGIYYYRFMSNGQTLTGTIVKK